MLTAHFETVTKRRLPSPMQYAVNQLLMEFGDGMTVVTAGLNRFLPVRGGACVRPRVRTRKHTILTVTTVTTVTQQSKNSVTVVVTVSSLSILLSPVRISAVLIEKGVQRHV